MNKRIYLIIFLLTCKICNAQNLVPNGDFEQYSGCPTAYGQLDSALFWMNPTAGTPDYYNQCSNSSEADVPYNNWGYQPANSGNGYGGIYIYISFNAREYLESPLTVPLIANNCYQFEMHVNLANACVLTTDAIGVYFSNTAVTGVGGATPLLFTPQINNTPGNIIDTLSWISVSGTYIAQGGENYLIIGNFKDDASTNAVLANDSGTWYGAYFFIDDVSLTYSPCTGIEDQNQHFEIKIYPNPVIDKLNISINNNELSEIILFDITSRKVLQQKFTNSVSLNTKQLVKGIYMYEVRNKNEVIKKGKVVKD